MSTPCSHKRGVNRLGTSRFCYHGNSALAQAQNRARTVQAQRESKREQKRHRETNLVRPDCTKTCLKLRNSDPALWSTPLDIATLLVHASMHLVKRMPPPWWTLHLRIDGTKGIHRDAPSAFLTLPDAMIDHLRAGRLALSGSQRVSPTVSAQNFLLVSTNELSCDIR